jgi:hypothetical protein
MSELAIVASQTPPSDHGPTELGICGPITDATTPAQRAVASRWCARPPARASDSRATSVEHTSRHPLHARERRSGQVDCGGVQAVGQGLPLCRALCFRPPPGKVRAGVCPPSLSGRQACLGGATWRSVAAQPACSCRVAAGPIRGAAGAAGDDPRRYRHLSAVASRRPRRGVSPGHRRLLEESWPCLASLGTSLEPMSPVPPITTTFVILNLPRVSHRQWVHVR